MTPRYVLDASAAVKWVRDERGRREARELLRRQILGEIVLFMPEQCVAELLAVALRAVGPEVAGELWRRLRLARIAIVPLHDALVAEAVALCASTGCSFYDALAPALATELGATLVSADARAHAEFQGVELI